ncbi:MAG: phosphate ABC transporter substrate-binding protein PstS [Candidatus Dormibacteraeota bacterium]|nr:phosphate ABC transporter substrate-binding protein PstS [Candidatus Dormibacteraeota bacterium]MBV9526152.1 phosphate ABC transporter substrate-binding protein PstS [Candidatus Dormibacteraeota bacterium]
MSLFEHHLYTSPLKRPSRLLRAGWLTASVGGALLAAACGGSSSTGGGGTTAPSATPSSVCQGTTAPPGYTNGVSTVSGQATSLSGAGGTFIAPMMSIWTSQYASSNGVQVAYQSVGSGAGIAQLQAGTVDFGESDAFMTDSDISKAKGPVVQVPLAQAPVTVAYNLPGVTRGLHLDGDTIGKIFAGQITSWTDPAIKSLNPNVTLPNLPIAVVHRSDGSGTTSIFTDYLTKESPSWVSALGGPDKSKGKTIAWPVGIGGKGNEGVSAAVGQNNGAIGYVELAYAASQNLTYADVKNKAGDFVEPCVKTAASATVGITSYPADLRIDVVDQSTNTDAYPITGLTWGLVYQNQTDKAKAAALVNFFSWVLTKGQDMAATANYTPLGSDLQKLCIAQLHKLTLNGSPVAP